MPSAHGSPHRCKRRDPAGHRPRDSRQLRGQASHGNILLWSLHFFEVVSLMNFRLDYQFTITLPHLLSFCNSNFSLPKSAHASLICMIERNIIHVPNQRWSPRCSLGRVATSPTRDKRVQLGSDAERVRIDALHAVRCVKVRGSRITDFFAECICFCLMSLPVAILLCP